MRPSLFRSAFVAAALSAAAAVTSAATLQVNAGGAATGAFFPDSSPVAFAQGGARYVSTTVVNGTDLQAVYSTHRYGQLFSYAVPATAGIYTVAMHFAETYGRNYKDGARVFDVAAGDSPTSLVDVLTDFDLHATAGAANALTVTRTVTVATDALVLRFTAKANNAMLSGLTITTEDGSFPGAGPVTGGAVATPTPAAPVATPAPGTPPVGVAPGDLPNPGEADDGAHAVPGGPYTAIADADDGSAAVALDGTGSHTHNSGAGSGSDGNGNGEDDAISGFGGVVAFTWSVLETEEILGTTPTLTARFPAGVTNLMLTVKDFDGDVHADVTTVTVTDGTATGVVCYYHEGVKALSAVGKAATVAPAYVAVAKEVSFGSLGDFGGFSFASDAWLARCVGTYTATAAEDVDFDVEAVGGDVRLAIDGKVVDDEVALAAGAHSFELVYAKAAGASAALVVTAPAAALSHDAGAVLPVIMSMSPSSGGVGGGATIQLKGFGFLPGESVSVGGKDAKIVSDVAGLTTIDEISFIVPAGAADGPVAVTVKTANGVSNAVTYTYASGTDDPQPPVYEETVLKNAGGGEFKLDSGTSIAVGPDGLVYIGNRMQGRVHKLKVDFLTHTVKKECSTEIGGQILGVSFSPADTAAQPTLLVSVGDLKSGKWNAGRVVALKSLATGCFGPPKDLVTGLPVQINHDHSIGRPAFMQNGDMLLPVGGITNAGIKHPQSGNVDESPLSGAVVHVALSKGSAFNGKVTYSTNNPASAKQTGGDVSVWAAGIRNGLNVERHGVSGTYWILDNGGNAGFGHISVTCNQDVGFKGKGNSDDWLYKLTKGGYYGHPNRNRGKTDQRQCTYRKPKEVAPGYTQPLAKFQASTNGLATQHTNVFGGSVKGNLYMSKFSTGGDGVVHTATVSATGKLGPVKVVKSWSGLSIAITPFGSLYMPRVRQGKVVVLAAKYNSAGRGPMVMSVTPNRGPRAGDYRVYVAGHNFPADPVVTMGGAPCTDVQMVGNVGLTCVMPAGQGKVSATVAGVTAAGHDFEYMSV